jgi:hypothetical protein
MQNIAAIQTNANQIGEGNTNIAYALGHLHLALSYNSYEDWCIPIMSKGTTTMIININHRRKIRERRSFSYLSFTPLFFNFQLVCAYVCVVFLAFTLIFSFYFSFHHVC